MQTTTRRPMTVTADGRGVVRMPAHGCLAELADRNTLTGHLSAALAGLAHDGPARESRRGLARPRSADCVPPTAGSRQSSPSRPPPDPEVGKSSVFSPSA